jgi:hypothetical protein
VLVGVGVGFGGVMLATMVGSAFPPWAMMVTIWLIVFVVIRVFMDFARRKHAGRIVESLLRIGRCPGCGYDLRGATPESDGVCVCPECAAAWKRERVGHAPVLRADRPITAETRRDTPSVLAALGRFVRRTPTIVDDRNRSVARVGMSLPGLENEIGAPDALEARREVSRATVVRRYGCAIPIVLVGLLVVVGSGVTMFKSRVALMSALSLLFAAWMLLVYTSLCWRILAGRMASTSKPVVRILRRRSICPSCAASLAGLIPEPDGCVVCTRCAAAWRVSPPTVHGSAPNTTSV